MKIPGSSKYNYPQNKTIVDLFEEQVKKSPTSLAVVFEDERLTYQQLDEQSNRFANYLRSRGVKEETYVPLCINCCSKMIVGILGILKAGACYVPIDPENPVERVKYMVEDTRAEVFVSNAKSLSVLKGIDCRETILLDDDWTKIAAMPADSPVSRPMANHLIYLIYTSGSTGKPKGVMVEHHSIVDYVYGFRDHTPVESCKSFALGSTMAADLGNTVVYSSLFLGGVLHLFAKEKFNDTEFIHKYFKDNPVDCLKIVPSHWKSLSLSGKGLFPKKLLVFGGETLHSEIVNEIYNDSEAACTVVNHYGPTETTIGKLLHVVNKTGDYSNTIPIGKPFSNANVYVLNTELKTIPDGEPGEIFIAGDGVARGYLNRNEITAERFIQDPSGNPGEKMYRTGDIGRVLPDGNIEFLGRADDQVKIRGYRIELGEIENVLQQNSSVKQCVVLAKESKTGDKRLIAYIVPEAKFNREAIATFLETRLPDYMVPRLLVEMEKIPFTANGKVDKKLLPDPDPSDLLTNIFVAAKSKTEDRIVSLWKELLGVKRVGITDNFFELGGNSLLAQKTVSVLRQENYHLPVTKLYQFPTAGGVAAFLDGKTSELKLPRRKQTSTGNSNNDVAIIGMSGRFPGANTIEELWNVLINGRDTIRTFTDEELDTSIPLSIRNDRNYIKARGIIEKAEEFDASFFGINPKLAELMDPQHRVFLEVSWELLERAGYIPVTYEGTIGVYAGSRTNTYYSNNVLPNKDLIDKVGSMQVTFVNDKDYLSTRVAYALDLKGPAVTVQSASSTSLLAIAQAAEAIRKGHCDMAIAGGVSIICPINSGHLYEDGAMYSRDGHCRPFDADAQGTVFSDGAGALLLKSREQAEKDGDIIFAVIKGVGLSNDGGGKGSFTAPSAEGQAAAICMAINDAGITPMDISYIEAHGTATPLGDPIEMEGLNLAFGNTDKKQYCAIGSLKSNVGHLATAAGVAGVIKATLSLYNKKIPASINYKTPNPNIDFENSPFKVNTSLRDWTTDKTRIAGVSAFGVGGTNVHIILEEAANAVHESVPKRPVHLITWSAKSESSVDAYGNKLSDYVSGNNNADIDDLAYTLNSFRHQFNFRRFVVAADNSELAEKLADKNQLALSTKKITEAIQEVTFMFPGQGAQYVNMGKDLYNSESVFKEAMDECAHLLSVEMKENILDVIYPAETGEEATNKLKNTRYSQPALFAIGYSLAKLWMSWGVHPSSFIGHSIGEFIAAHFSGVFSLQDALKLIAIRGRLMSDLPGGSMLSVRTSAEKVEPLLPADISLAAVNSPNLCVVAGTYEAINAFSSVLDEKGISNKALHTSHAFHSLMMEPVVAPFKAVVQSIKLNAPVIPIMSTVTGEWLKSEEATDPEYWARHLRSTVLFSNAAKKLIDDNKKAFLEIGPGNVTATLTRQQAAGKNLVILSSLEKASETQADQYPMLKALGQLWLSGIEPAWTSYYKDEKRKKLYNLPTYAFQKKKYWVDPPLRVPSAAVQDIQPGLNLSFITEAPVLTQQTPNQIISEPPVSMRKENLVQKLKDILEDASGIDMQSVTPDMSFIEVGLDSLLLTQISLTLKKQFNVPITFRQLNEEYGTLNLLADYLNTQLPPEVVKQETRAAVPAQMQYQQPIQNVQPVYGQVAGNNAAIELINLQLQMLMKQIALMQGNTAAPQQIVVPAPAPAQQQPIPAPSLNGNGTSAPKKKASDQSDLSAEEAAEIKKPFGAAARIEKQSVSLTDKQKKFLADFTQHYNQKTAKSKEYTQKHRRYMADPRVVSGFRPTTKELVYSIVINKSKGCRLWDIDGNEYIDALNGFGSNMLGYQPDFLKKALIEQIEKGYEIGPQHELSGEVCKLICEFTNFDRAALCNTGSEAVLGAMRIARTVTGRSLIVAFAGSYHGIVDEVIVRGSKKLKSFPAAPGIMPEAVQNILVLEYGTEESLKIIKERANELAAVLVEPIQGKRAEFQPVEFLKKLRQVTEESETVLIFDEVISGFRFHPGGMQALFGIKADIGTYGKVAGGGVSVGIIAGKAKYMDALDGGFWQYGDDSIPEVGVTYFAGTFVRHPLALAATKASLTYLKEQGPQLQATLNANATYIANTLNKMCQDMNVPIYIAQYGSLWRVKFKEEFSYSELLFTLMRYKGIHILEGFNCFLTTSHTSEDIMQIISKFEESLTELKEAGFIPNYQHTIPTEKNVLVKNDFNSPPLPNARLGKDKNGNPAWFIKDEKNPGKYLQVN